MADAGAADTAGAAEAAAKEQAEKQAAAKEAAAKEAALEEEAAAQEAAALKEAERLGGGWAAQLAQAMAFFCREVNFVRLRGIDAVLCGGDRSGPCPAPLLQAVLAAVAERNHIRTHPEVEKVLRRVGAGALSGGVGAAAAAAAAAAATATATKLPCLLWETRWTSRRERVAGVVACFDSDSDNSDGEVGGGGTGIKSLY
jgi:hypothetical protein